MPFEIAVGLQIIKDGRHESEPITAPVQLSAVAGHKADVVLLPDNEHTEHLALVGFGLEFGRSLCNPAFHFVHGCAAKHIGLVAERIVHAGRKGRDGQAKWVEYHFNLLRSRISIVLPSTLIMPSFSKSLSTLRSENF